MNEDKAARLAAIRAANAQKAAAAQPSGATVAVQGTDPPAAPSRPARPAPPPATIDDEPSAVALSTLFTMLFAAIIGAFAAAVALPQWLPGLSESLLAAEPKAYWYLARSSGLVAFGLLWLSMLLGLSITGKVARIWPGGPTVFDLHQFTSLLALAFSLFHALILLGDTYIDYRLVQLLLPFGSSNFRPIWVGLGQIALYVLAVIDISFYLRPRIGRPAWRAIHFLSFAVFLLALGHAVVSGSDTAAPWIRTMYWFSGGSLLFLTIYRCLIARSPAKQPATRST